MIRYILPLPLLFPVAALATSTDVCDSAAERAAAETGVPFALLRAITRVETGRDGAPWPWTLNIGGKGYWFATMPEALAAAESALADGADQIDVGCFQLNFRWHGAFFADLSTMMDPVANARYAADFLADLQSETGDWRAAAAAYHSRTQELGDAYVARLEAAYDNDTTALPAPAEDMPNRYPLLIAGDVGSQGSIVPRGQGVMPLIGAP